MIKWLALTTLLLLSSICAHAASAEMTFSGRYEFRTDQESLDMLGKQVCFFPSGSSARQVPRPVGDKRLPWFCFSDSEAAARMLGFRLTTPAQGCGVGGRATVTVSSYVLYTKEGDGNDMADIKAVIRKTGPESLPCSQKR